MAAVLGRDSRKHLENFAENAANARGLSVFAFVFVVSVLFFVLQVVFLFHSI